jgi:hypothetical protein
VPDIELTDVHGVDHGTRPWAQPDATPSRFSEWRDNILDRIPEEARDEARQRLSVLDPAPDNEPKNSINSEFWKKASASLQTEERARKAVALLTDLACSDRGAPYVWRGLLRNHIAAHTQSQLIAVAARLREAKSDYSGCSGVTGFNDEDWASLEALMSKPARGEKAK